MLLTINTLPDTLTETPGGRLIGAIKCLASTIKGKVALLIYPELTPKISGGKRSTVL
jgi:hypothetical protein